MLKVYPDTETPLPSEKGYCKWNISNKPRCELKCMYQLQELFKSEDYF